MRIYFIICLYLVSIMSLPGLSQSYNAIEWGTYFNDEAQYPSYNYGDDEFTDQIIADHKNPESIYVVGQTRAAPQFKLPLCGDDNMLNYGGGDGYLAKYNSCGDLVWSAYIGDFIQCLALDEENGKTVIYVAGKKSGVITTHNAFSCDEHPALPFQLSAEDGSAAFIAKFEDNDTMAKFLRWTYFDGTSDIDNPAVDNILGLAIYRHRIFVTGNTLSTNIGDGALLVENDTYSGEGDVFIAEFDSLLSTLRYFSYLGGEGNDRPHDIKFFDHGNDSVDLFISGTTSSATCIASGSGFDTSYNESTDAFLCKWQDADHDGIFTQTWGTYLGGSLYDHGRQSTLDDKGNVIIAEFGKSQDLPVTAFAYDKEFATVTEGSPKSDIGIFKVNNNGGLEWCSYFGGTGDEMVNGLEFLKTDSGNFLVFAGLTKSISSDFDLVLPLQDSLNGNNSEQNYDGFISILTDVTESQQELVFSTYLGGSGVEGVSTGVSYHPGVALGMNHELYFSIATKSADINGVIGSEFQQLIHPFTGGADAFIAKLIDTNNPAQSNWFYADNDGDGYGNPDSGIITCTPPANFVSNNQDCNDNLLTGSTIHPGAPELCNSIDDDCNGLTDDHAITVAISPSGTISSCDGTNIDFFASGTNIDSYQWFKDDMAVSGATNSFYSSKNGTSFYVSVSNGFGCGAVSAITTVNRINKPNAVITVLNNGNLDLCMGEVKLKSSGNENITYQWSLENAIISGATNRKYIPSLPGNYKVKVTNIITGCNKFSKPVTVVSSCKQPATTAEKFSTSLLIYPSVTNGIFTIEFSHSSLITTPALVKVINLIGQAVYAENVLIENGKLLHQIMLDPITPDGMYLVLITWNDEVYEGKLIYRK